MGIIWWALKNRKNENASDVTLGKSQNWFVVGSLCLPLQCEQARHLWGTLAGFYKWCAVFNYNVGAIFVIIFVSLFFLPFYIKSLYTIRVFDVF